MSKKVLSSRAGRLLGLALAFQIFDSPLALADGSPESLGCHAWMQNEYVQLSVQYATDFPRAVTTYDELESLWGEIYPGDARSREVVEQLKARAGDLYVHSSRLYQMRERTLQAIGRIRHVREEASNSRGLNFCREATRAQMNAPYQALEQNFQLMLKNYIQESVSLLHGIEGELLR
jgi:hypothetical protein